MRHFQILSLLFVVLVISACSAGKPEPLSVHLGQPFMLAGGQEAQFEQADLRVVFQEVLEDSRCPTQVECFWTGQARILLSVQVGQEAPTDVEFNTNPAPGMTMMTAEVAGYLLELQSLEPYPETPDDPIALRDYRAGLLVSDFVAARSVSSR